MKRFPASLGARERLVTYGVGYGVGMGVPLVLGIAFAVGFGDPRLLLFPLPFVVAFGLPYFFRPVGFGISRREVLVLRPVGPKRFPMREIRQARYPAEETDGASIGLVRVDGVHGRFGTFWSRKSGRYAAYVTNPDNRVELQLRDDIRVFVSPDDPEAFVQTLRLAVAESGTEPAVSARSLDSPKESL